MVGRTHHRSYVTFSPFSRIVRKSQDITSMWCHPLLLGCEKRWLLTIMKRGKSEEKIIRDRDCSHGCNPRHLTLLNSNLMERSITQWMALGVQNRWTVSRQPDPQLVACKNKVSPKPFLAVNHPKAVDKYEP